MRISRNLTIGVMVALCPAIAQAQSHVRFVNAAPAQLQSVYVTFDGGSGREIEYGRTTPRIDVAEGSRKVTVTTAGQNPVLLIEKTITLTKDKSYTLAITGELLRSNYEVRVAEDDDSNTQGHLRVRYGLLSGGFVVNGTALTPDLHVVCDGLNDIRVTGQTLKFTAYADVTVPSSWIGAVCQVSLEVKQNGVSVPVWQDYANYFFSPHTAYTMASIGTDPATAVVIRETDNK